jgi:hypothetical protein
MHQSGLETPPGAQLGDAVFLAEAPPLNELDFQAGDTSRHHGMITDRVAQGFSEQAQIEATNVGEVKLPLRSGGMTHVQQTASDDDAVKTTQRPGNLRSISGNQ